MIREKITPFFKLSALMLCLAFTVNARAAAKYYYQIKVYHLKTQAQVDNLDKYLKDAYLPALHRQGIPHVGVFKPVEQDTADKRVYVFIPFKSMDKLETTDATLLKDAQYVNDGKDYLNAAYNAVPYTRMETIVLRAFPQWPEPTLPQLSASKAERVYELRSYESPTEEYHINKVKMFNDGGETALFKRLNFNAVFYGDVLVGSHMPNLMYMTTFNNKADREKHWESFSNAPEWKTLSALPEYQHNVSKVEITFVHPADYSDY